MCCKIVKSPIGFHCLPPAVPFIKSSMAFDSRYMCIELVRPIHTCGNAQEAVSVGHLVGQCPQVDDLQTRPVK